MKRSLNNIDMDVFIVNYCLLFKKTYGDPNEIVCIFSTSFRKLLDKHALLKKIRTKPHPWYDQEIESVYARLKICGGSKVSIL